MSQLDDKNSLVSNIEIYKKQLDDVTNALEVTRNEKDKCQLEQLQSDLMTILELTLTQLQQVEASSVQSSTSQIEEMDEYERFKLEIAALEGTSTDSTALEGTSKDSTALERTSTSLREPSKNSTAYVGNCTSNSDTKNTENKSTVNDTGQSIANLSNEVELELKALEGEAVRAPYREKWGGFTYHNGVILSACPLREDSENPQVLVLFSQPTCVAMLSCKFFLDGRCKFNDEGCKFSHGEKVLVKDLRDYREPDRDSVVAGSDVLALHGDHDLWHRGKVEDVLEGRKGFSMDCSICNEVVEVNLEAMIPIVVEDEVEEKTPATVENLPVDENEDTVFIPHEAWLSKPCSTKLGQWEQYTKGIASKLMAKMGYIVGTGLGPKGEGRVEPVETFVYPQGVSLDHCKKLREAGKGECLLSVEKRLLKQSKKEEEKKKRQSQTLREKTSVFDIINCKLATKGKDKDEESDSPGKEKLDVSRSSLQKDTTKELNRKNFQLSSSIDKLKNEILSLKQSKSRHTSDAVVSASLDKKLKDKIEKLKSLQTAEGQIESERMNRKNMRKWSVF